MTSNPARWFQLLSIQCIVCAHVAIFTSHSIASCVPGQVCTGGICRRKGSGGWVLLICTASNLNAPLPIGQSPDSSLTSVGLFAQRESGGGQDHLRCEQVDKSCGGGIIAPKPRWRNWHTRQVEGLCLSRRAGSNPVRGNENGDRSACLRFSFRQDQLYWGSS